MLDVEGANPAPGAILWQYGANGTRAQDYSFEEAGDGFVYLRSLVSNLYVTARPSGPTLADAGPAGVANNPPATPNDGADGPELIQDEKYVASRTVANPLTPNPQQQKRRFAPAGITVLDQDLFVISNQAYPGLILQPTIPSQVQSPVTLAAPEAAGPLHPQDTWKVTSPLIGNQIGSKT
jgi:hypothetical protein